MPGSRLIQRIQEISHRAGFIAVAVSFYDYESTVAFSYHADRYFHAASTIKVALLLAVLKAAEEGKLNLSGRLHVRNRFHSVVDGAIYRVSPDRDGDAETHRRIGRAVPIGDLARAMIVRSSNLATNLLFDFLGRDYIRGVVEQAGIAGLKFERGVEDEAAFAQGLNNEVTADGLLQLFRVFCDRRLLSEESCERAIAILLAQEFNGMIPAKLPGPARVAHKTGEISTACHDAGIVFLPDRQPYVVAILTEGPPEQRDRQKAVAAISGAIFHHLTDVVKRDA
ncbi:MAG: beta-lactamase class [Chthoniobacter sp.]|jgi:beta-lactamase class A|nr:beta-lactamase class [Chthoniobacter sp.]